MHIKVGDKVKVLTGFDKDVEATVLQVDRQAGKIVVEGVNEVRKHVRRSQKNPQGGQLHKEMPMAISNVQLVCSSCGKSTRTGARYLEDGSKERYCKKCKAGLGQLSPAKARYAKKS